MQTANNIDVPALNLFLKMTDLVTEIFGLNIPALVQLETIKSLPSGTLGRSLADFLEENQLQPFTTGMRRKQLHDCIHVLTGYDSTPIGEAEVQAFLLGCKSNLPNSLIFSRIKLKIQRTIGANSPEYKVIQQRLINAHTRGKNSHLDPDSWQPELLWAEPLEVVRSTFKVAS